MNSITVSRTRATSSLPLSGALLAAACALQCGSGDTSAGWVLLLREDFSSTSSRGLAANWTACAAVDWVHTHEEPFGDSGSWRVEDSTLAGYNQDGFSNLTFRRPITGDIRVEWDVTPLRRNLNLNCFIAGNTRRDGYTFHVAGYDDPRVVVLTKGQAIQPLDQFTFREGIQLGRTYQFRMEKSGQCIRLWIDGRQVFNYRDYDELSGPGHQTFGFENNLGNRIRIDNVLVYHRPLPPNASPLEQADEAFGEGDHSRALRAYRDATADSLHPDVGALAMLKTGRCLEALDSVDAAFDTYLALEEQFPRHELSAIAAAQRARIYESRGDTAASEQTYRTLARRFPGHAVLRTAFFGLTASRERHRLQLVAGWVRDSSDDGSTAAWLEREATRMQALGAALGVPLEGNMFIENALADLLSAGVYTPAQAERTFPEQREVVATAYLSVGDYQTVVDRFSSQAQQLGEALLAQGRFREVVRRASQSRASTATALLALGEYPRVLREYTDQRKTCASAVYREGDFDRLFGEYRDIVDTCLKAARMLGRVPEYLAAIEPDPYSVASALLNGSNKPDIALLVLEPYVSQFTLRETLLACGILRELGRFRESVERFGTTYGLEPVHAHTLMMAGWFDEARRRYPVRADVQIRILRERGLFGAIESRFAGYVTAQLEALFCMGKLDDIAAYQPNNDSQVSLALYLQGNYRQVLRRCPQMRDVCAEALLAMGEHEGVLKKYSDQRVACGRAWIALEGVERALELYPECRPFCARYLLDKGAYAEVLYGFADQPFEYGEALVALERFAEAPVNQGRVRVPARQAYDLQSMHALGLWRTGSFAAADSVLSAVPASFQLLWYEHRFTRFLLRPVLHALRADKAGFLAECVRLRNAFPDIYGKRLWFEAGFLADLTAEEQFLGQPFGFGAARRLLFMRAVRDDIAGRRATALTGYRAWLEFPAPELAPEILYDLDRSRTVRRFAAWRAEVCAAGNGPSLQDHTTP